ncbi:MAG: GNAT family N-acetyltransferase [Thalassovita sp.]
MRPAPLQQSSEYAQALSAIGADVVVDRQLCLRRKLPVVGTIGYLPRGNWPARPPTGMTLINATDADQDNAIRAAGALPLMTPQTLAVLELGGTETDWLTAMHGKWRNRLRAALDGPLVLHSAEFCSKSHTWLLDRETAQRADRGYTTLPHALIRAYPQDQTLVIEAHLNDVPVAAMLFLLHPPGATYHIGWSGPEGRKANAHNLILWHAMHHLQLRGITHLELGTLDSINAPGLARFKLGSGAKPLKLGHSWLYLPRLAPLFRAIRRVRGFPSGLLSKGSIGGPRTSQDTPHGSAQHRNYRPR